MTTSHLQVVSKQPAKACLIPTAPAFITTFQCLGQFILGVLTQFDGGGFAALGDLVVGFSNFLGGEGGLFTAFLSKGNIGG